MPGLTGFQTAEELKRLGSRAKIVFLTMHQDDDFVSMAIRCGAMGYVVKTLASSDLTPTWESKATTSSSMPRKRRHGSCEPVGPAVTRSPTSFGTRRRWMFPRVS
jgi:DNA-binding NarL/FixJ family response regulator